MLNIRGKLRPLIRYLAAYHQRVLIRNHVDAKFYLDAYPDVRAAGADPVSHYLNYGWREGRNPSPTFDTRYYISRYMKDVSTETCPLIHYVETGVSINNTTNAAEEERRALQDVDRVLSAQVRELARLLNLEVAALDVPKLRSIVIPLFSSEIYREKKGLARDLSALELLTRYLAFDFLSGMPPGLLFDEDHYRREAARRELRVFKQHEPAFLHWLTDGVDHRVSPSPIYSDKEYLSLNPDLKSWHSWPFEHFVRHGIDENRKFNASIALAANPAANVEFVPKSRTRSFLEWCGKQEEAAKDLAELHHFVSSEQAARLVEEAALLEPDVGRIDQSLPRILPPWHDGAYAAFAEMRRTVPTEQVDAVVLMPFCKLGGADYVASVLARVMLDRGKVAVLRTDLPDWERPDWFPEDVISVDISAYLKSIPERWAIRSLYELVRDLRPKTVFNVNSHAAFKMMQRFGSRLATFTDFFNYYFCSDLRPDGSETGYPVWYFAELLPYSRAALIDNTNLADKLSRRYHLSPNLKQRVKVIHTPAMGRPRPKALVHEQVESAQQRPRPVMLWAGRFDRQKRFDLFLRIAEALPEVEFLCWGKAVLDKQPSLDNLPSNVKLQGTFSSYDELPIERSDGWLYTSAWDGLPTILIELGAMGVPIVASAVGGVPELIDDTTGWPVPASAAVADYVAAVKRMLAVPEERIRRAEALLARVRERHSTREYRSQLFSLLEQGEANHS